jgi:hypothetical protein
VTGALGLFLRGDGKAEAKAVGMAPVSVATRVKSNPANEVGSEVKRIESVKGGDQSEKESVKRLISEKPTLAQVPNAQNPKGPEQWASLEGRQKVSATLFVSLPMEEMKDEYRESLRGAQERDPSLLPPLGYETALARFGDLRHVLLLDDPNGIGKAAREYLDSITALGTDEAGESKRKFYFKLGAESKFEEMVDPVLLMAAVYANCIAENQCGMELEKGTGVESDTVTPAGVRDR